ncbi:leukocyte antigen CD37 isoform X2 [Anomalospiza imberbis]|uniref:leukocyte antigen CD37 isoform X2 n=1 Tax=Anomalospiza imberbis TaxID=187417 RepID=UPI00359002EB
MDAPPWPLPHGCPPGHLPQGLQGESPDLAGRKPGHRRGGLHRHQPGGALPADAVDVPGPEPGLPLREAAAGALRGPGWCGGKRGGLCPSIKAVGEQRNRDGTGRGARERAAHVERRSHAPSSAPSTWPRPLSSGQERLARGPAPLLRREAIPAPPSGPPSLPRRSREPPETPGPGPCPGAAVAPEHPEHHGCRTSLRPGRRHPPARCGDHEGAGRGGEAPGPSITRVPPSAPAESGCSDEFALDCTFAACDPERTGMVQPQQVVEYVAAMTGHSGHDGRLQALRRALDPAAAGTALDWTRFRMAMGAWIAACRQDGAEEQDVATGDTGLVPAEDNGHASPTAAQLQGDNTDITTHAEATGLRSRARQLAAQNAKLQRDAELAEELNARLAEEIAQLQTQLRSSRQALEQARVAVDELDDMKAVVKRLEEENTELRRQARHAEKEQRSLCSQAECLQEENQRLLAEGQGLREQIQVQVARMDSLEAQLCRGTALLSARDAALAQAGQRAQELTAALEEYERMVQELRLETTRLRQQLGQMRDAWAMRPWCPRGQLVIQATAVVASPVRVGSGGPCRVPSATDPEALPRGQGTRRRRRRRTQGRRCPEEEAWCGAVRRWPRQWPHRRHCHRGHRCHHGLWYCWRCWPCSTSCPASGPNSSCTTGAPRPCETSSKGHLGTTVSTLLHTSSPKHSSQSAQSSQSRVRVRVSTSALWALHGARLGPLVSPSLREIPV